MKFSFVIPAYNEAKYIGACIRSIQSQTIPPFEIIVVDNGSSDRTSEIAKSLGAKVVFEGKKGIAHARNRGANMARGDTLCFIDADSRLRRDWAERSIYHFKRGSFAAVGINVFTNKNPLKFVWYNVYTVLAHTTLAFNNFFFGKLHLSAGNLAIKRSIFVKTGGYEPYVGEDYWLSKKFWKLKYSGSFDPLMVVYSSSRGFEKRGMLATVWYWLRNTPRKVDQSAYSWRSEV